MNILKKVVKLHPKSFEPIAEITIEIPLGFLMDGPTLFGKDEFAKIFLQEFMEKLLDFKNKPEGNSK